jgi:hypothetical protein
MQCPFCKNETSSIMNFCESCGKDLTKENKMHDSVTIRRKFVNQIIVWCIGLILFGILSVMVAPYRIGLITGFTVMTVGVFGIIMRKRFMFLVIAAFLFLFVAVYVFVSVIIRDQLGLIGLVLTLPFVIYGVINIRRFISSKEAFKKK